MKTSIQIKIVNMLKVKGRNLIQGFLPFFYRFYHVKGGKIVIEKNIN